MFQHFRMQIIRWLLNDNEAYEFFEIVNTYMMSKEKFYSRLNKKQSIEIISRVMYGVYSLHKWESDMVQMLYHILPVLLGENSKRNYLVNAKSVSVISSMALKLFLGLMIAILLIR